MNIIPPILCSVSGQTSLDVAFTTMVWVVLCLLIAFWATKINRRGWLWFFLSFLISPLLSAIILLCIGRPKAAVSEISEPESFQYECPSCRQHFEVDMSYAGTSVECPQCRQTILFPSKAELTQRLIPETSRHNTLQAPKPSGNVFVFFIVLLIVGCIGIVMYSIYDNQRRAKEEYASRIQERVLTWGQLKNVTGRAGFVDNNLTRFEGTLYNGNEDIRITAVTIGVGTMDEDKKTVREYMISVDIPPKATGHFGFDTLWAGRYHAWDVRNAKGTPVW